MSKNNKPAPPSRLKQGQDGPQPAAIGPELKIKGGYQPTESKISPQKPPSNPPNKGSSGKK